MKKKFLTPVAMSLTALLGATAANASTTDAAVDHAPASASAKADAKFVLKPSNEMIVAQYDGGGYGHSSHASHSSHSSHSSHASGY